MPVFAARRPMTAVDFAARRKQAREEMKPHHFEAARAKAEVVSLKEKLKAVKAANPKDKRIATVEDKIREQEKADREAQTKANAIDAAVFDLKAVNPNAVVNVDSRTPVKVNLLPQHSRKVLSLPQMQGTDRPLIAPPTL